MIRSLQRVLCLATASSLRLQSGVPPLVAAAAARPVGIRAATYASGAGASSLEDEIKSTIASDPVVIYSKSYCPFCEKTKSLFNGLGIEYKAVELDLMDGGDELQAALLSMSGQRTVPNVFIKGKHLGGNDDTQKAAKSGKLQELLG